MAHSSSVLEAQAFPVLTVSQISSLRPFGATRTARAGENRANDDKVLRTSGPGEFNGELGLLTGQRAFVACIVDEPTTLLFIQSSSVHEIIATIPTLSDILVAAFAARRQLLMRDVADSLTIIGSEKDSNVLHLLEFADRNRIPHRWLNPANPEDSQSIATREASEGDPFRVVIGKHRVMDHPTPQQIARAVGLELKISGDGVCDLIVVGAGPAGLAAAVYGASEGLSAVVVEDTAIGGQAGTSSRIENYVGFPTGISGNDLAFRAEIQALKFGARITVPRRATALENRQQNYAVHLDESDDVLLGRSVVIATGARYRGLDIAGEDTFSGVIYHAATELEARRCRGKEVVVVGGANSAGQAAMFLSEHASQVHLLCRGSDLKSKMSQYLVDRLEHAPNVEICLHAEVVKLYGKSALETVEVKNNVTGISTNIPTSSLFVMIGADPCTGWLKGSILLDSKGFVRTGESASASLFQSNWAGVFAIGDVRSGSVKRVASAVGEGSVVIQAVHRYLTSLRELPPTTETNQS
jgi:thioredoxin reductase (NADPH)